MSMIHDSDAACQQPHERQLLLRRPTWAMESTFLHDTEAITGVRHGWFSSTVAAMSRGADRAPLPTTVQVVQLDDLAITEEGMAARAGRPVVFLTDLDAEFPDTAEARRFAAAIVEACDQLDSAGGTR